MEKFRQIALLKYFVLIQNQNSISMSFHDIPTYPKVSKKMKEEWNKIKTTSDLISKVSKTKDWSRNDSSNIKIPFEDIPTPPKYPNIKETADLIGAKKKTPSFQKISTNMRILLSGFLTMHKFH